MMHVIRIKTLPFKRDGFWMGIVRRMKPLDRKKQWLSTWVEDGPNQEVRSQVVDLF